jgi:hypothetical protein
LPYKPDKITILKFGRVFSRRGKLTDRNMKTQLTTAIKKCRWFHFVLIALVLGQAACLLWFNLTQLQVHLGYDASSLYLKTYEVWKQGTVFCKNWVDTTMLHLDDNVPLSALLMNVTHNVYTAVGISNMITGVAILAALCLLMKELKLTRGVRLLAYVFMLCPFLSPDFDNFIDLSWFSCIWSSGSWYAQKLLFSLLFVWLWLRLQAEDVTDTRGSAPRMRRLVPAMCLVAAYYFISGVSSGYYMAATVLTPALLTGLLYMFCQNSLKELKRPAFVYTAVCLLLVVAGKQLQTGVLHYSSHDNLVRLIGIDQFWKNLGSVWQGMLELFSALPAGSYLDAMTKKGGMYALGLLILLILLAGFSAGAVRVIKGLRCAPDSTLRKPGCAGTSAAYPSLLPVMIAVWNLFMFALLNTRYGDRFFEKRYLIIPAVFMLLCLLQLLSGNISQLIWKKCLCGVFVLCLVGQTVCSDYIYLERRLPMSDMALISATVGPTEVPLVYFYGDNYDLLARNLRIYDTSRIYRYVNVTDSGPEIRLSDDYTYYSTRSEWNGETLLFTDKKSYDSLPDPVKNAYVLKQDLGGIILYAAKDNTLADYVKNEDKSQ